jgi:hypothetical protein
MVIKYTNIYHAKALQNLPKFRIFGLKTNHLATLLETCAALKWMYYGPASQTFSVLRVNGT